MPDPRVAEPRRGIRFHQVRWNRTWRNTRRLESIKKWPTGSEPRRQGRDKSRASIDEKHLDAKIETERPLYTQGPCRDSACGRQHEGVVSLVPEDAAPATAVKKAGGDGAR